MRQCFGTCRKTSTSPSTARSRMCSSRCTPAACMRSPPTPRNRNGAPRAPSSRATPDACVSPDGSPATNRISRTSDGQRLRRAPPATPFERGERLLDLAHDPQRDRERVAAILAGDDQRRLPLNRGNEALVLEAQRLSLGGLQL